MISSEVLVEQKTSLCVFFIIIIQPYSTDVVLTFSNGSDTSGISGYAINMISVPLGPLFEILVLKILLCHLLEIKRISRTIISNDCGPAKQYEFYRYWLFWPAIDVILSKCAHHADRQLPMLWHGSPKSGELLLEDQYVIGNDTEAMHCYYLTHDMACKYLLGCFRFSLFHRINLLCWFGVRLDVPSTHAKY